MKSCKRFLHGLIYGLICTLTRAKKTTAHNDMFNLFKLRIMEYVLKHLSFQILKQNDTLTYWTILVS